MDEQVFTPAFQLLCLALVVSLVDLFTGVVDRLLE